MIHGLLLAACLADQVSMDVYSGEKKVGSARVTQKLQTDGKKLVQVSVSLAGPQGGVTVREEATYQPNGEPARQVVEVTDQEGKRLATLVATFDGTGAHMVSDRAGKRTTATIPLGRTLPRANASEFWFIRDQPKVGAKVTYYRLDLSKQEWEQVTVRYVGKKSVNVGGRTVTAHCLEQGDKTIYSDDAGMPYLVKSPTATLVRK